MRRIVIDSIKSSDKEAIRSAIEIIPPLYEILSKTRDEIYVCLINVVGCIFRGVM
jgi:hypothetical protein